MKILLIFLPILALPLTRLSAIGITLDKIQFSIGYDSIEVYPPFSRFHMDNEQFPFINPNYAVDWIFGNGTESASLDGYTYVRGSGLSSSATVAFTLSEPVNFSITGNIRQPEWLDTSFTSIEAAIGQYSSIGSAYGYDNADDVPFQSLIGIFNPGQYVFRTAGYAFNTESNSQVHLLLTPVATPDGGSTLMMLGLAICAIGGVFRKVNLALSQTQNW